MRRKTTNGIGERAIVVCLELGGGPLSIHSLRVSLLTALAFEGRIRPEILMKLAGHARVLMTFYYIKQGAVATQDEINTARKRMTEDQGLNMAKWLKEYDHEQLSGKVVIQQRL